MVIRPITKSKRRKIPVDEMQRCSSAMARSAWSRSRRPLRRIRRPDEGLMFYLKCGSRYLIIPHNSTRSLGPMTSEMYYVVPLSLAPTAPCSRYKYSWTTSKLPLLYCITLHFSFYLRNQPAVTKSLIHRPYTVNSTWWKRRFAKPLPHAFS